MNSVTLKYQQVVNSWEYEEEGGYRYFMTPNEVFDYFGIGHDEKVLLLWVADTENNMFIRLTWGNNE